MKILSLDGGGIKGVIPAHILKQLKLNSSDFDLIAGTSTGSILAGALRIGMSPEQILEMYFEHGKKIFPSYGKRLLQGRFSAGLFKPRYSNKPLKKILKNFFHDRQIMELNGKTIINAYDIRKKEFVCYRSWVSDYFGVFLCDAILSSCSAPVYFPSNFDKVDGGVVVNNPSQIAIAAALKIGVKLEDIKLVSIGTGYTSEPISRVASKMGAISWGINFAGVTLSGTSQVVDYACRQMLGKNYVRINPELIHGKDSVDDSTDENLKGLVRDSILSSKGIEDVQKFVRK